MYLSVKEAAEYLSISEGQVEKLILQGKIRALHDGTGYMINKEQFNTHMEQMKKYKALIEEIMSEPIPEDRDIKDED